MASEVDLQLFEAPPTLHRFLTSDVATRMVLGPVGSGKSSACCFELLRRCCEVPHSKDGIRHSRWLIVRNTYRELRDTTIKTFSQWVPERLGKWSDQASVFTTRFDDVAAEFLFRALDRPGDASKLLSLELTGAYLNEAKEIPLGIVQMLQGRCGRFPSVKDLPAGVVAWSGIWADSNPPDEDHWIFRLFEENRPDGMTPTEAGFQIFHQPSGLAPDAENLPNLKNGRGYYEKLALDNSHDPTWVSVYVHAKYGFHLDGRPIYPEWQDRLHAAPCTPNPSWPILLGQDFGLTPAAVLCQVDPRDNQLQVFDELTSESMGAAVFGEQLAHKLKSEYPGRKVRGWGDPAGEQRAQTDERTPFDVMLAAGVPLDPAPTNDWIRRRESVAVNLRRLTMLGRPGLVIDPRCRMLRKAMIGGYCYRRLQVGGGERFMDKPDKTLYSHVAEALQYACVGEGLDRGPVDGDEGEGRRVQVRFRSIRAKGH